MSLYDYQQQMIGNDRGMVSPAEEDEHIKGISSIDFYSPLAREP